MRITPYPIRTFAATVLILAAPVGTAAAAISTSAASGPPSALFKKPAVELCKLASLAEMSKAAGKTIGSCRLSGNTTSWYSSDGNWEIDLFAQTPSGVPPLGKHANGNVKRVSVPGSKAVLDTWSHGVARYEKHLFATYPRGVVGLDMVSYSTAIPDAALIAVIRLVTRP